MLLKLPSIAYIQPVQPSQTLKEVYALDIKGTE
jgi:hypothetical protein